jgi:hypothetical protein
VKPKHRYALKNFEWFLIFFWSVFLGGGNENCDASLTVTGINKKLSVIMVLSSTIVAPLKTNFLDGKYSVGYEEGKVSKKLRHLFSRK